MRRSEPQNPDGGRVWRQGNLLHFGFEQSPAQMNLTGQQLLLNAIAYISRFTEDRPIAFTSSVFAGKVSISRAAVGRRFGDPTWWRTAWIEESFAPELWQQLAGKSRENLVVWASANAKFLHPDQNNQLEFDEDLVALNVAFDQPKFLDLVVQQLGGSPGEQARGRRLVERYLPDIRNPTDFRAVAEWMKENRPYAFASDSTEYRWYVDPLAKRRGVPTSELRGPQRADLPRRETDQ